MRHAAIDMGLGDEGFDGRAVDIAEASGIPGEGSQLVGSAPIVQSTVR